MQKGKRYRDTYVNEECWEIDRDDGRCNITIQYNRYGIFKLSYEELARYLQNGTLVELPDDACTPPENWGRYFNGREWVTGVVPQEYLIRRPGFEQRDCTSHTWVNYTPYHDASPMAKFACKSCNRERD